MKQLLLILLLLPVLLQAQEMSRSTPEEEGVWVLVNATVIVFVTHNDNKIKRTDYNFSR